MTEGQFSDDESSSSSSISDIVEEYYESESDSQYDQLDLNDQWDACGGDFAKKYNTLKNQMQVLSGTSQSAKPLKGQILNVIKQFRSVAVKPQVEQRVAEKEEVESQEKGQDLALKYSSRLQLNTSFFPSHSGRKADDGKYMQKDKADRATVEQVLDPRTRMILFKLINREVLYQVHGCISTGKEANVYHALTSDKAHLAIKIYKTSILVFKDRDRYVSGEYRFRHGYSKKNPRKMVQVWAEKEMRNLKRLSHNGIPCPETVVLRLHVLVMTLIGDKEGWAAPRLKDAVVKDEETYRDIYRQVVRILWVLYNKCRLVHGDFSEYNLLYQKKTVYVIDVSQSVEHDHPHALEFLRKDVLNVIEYFRKRLSDQIMTTRELFDFVVTDFSTIKSFIVLPEFVPTEEVLDEAKEVREVRERKEAIKRENHILDLYLDMKEVEIRSRPSNYLEDSELQVKEQVFQNIYIPRTLDEIDDHEADVEKLKKGEKLDLIYETVTGFNASEAIAKTVVEEVASDGEESSEISWKETKSHLKKDEDKEEKRERKRLVKEMKASKRETKIKKSVKKRLTSASKSK